MNKKLDEAKVRAIRKSYANGATQAAIAREYGMTSTYIGRIVRGECWGAIVTDEDLESKMAADLAKLEGLFSNSSDSSG